MLDLQFYLVGLELPAISYYFLILCLHEMISNWKFLFFFTCTVCVPTCKPQIYVSYLYFTINFLFIIHLIFVSHLTLLVRYFHTNASTRSLFMASMFLIANCIPLTHKNRDCVSIMLFQRENYYWTEHF